MTTLLAISGYVLFWAVIAAGLVLVTFTLPGTWLIVAAALGFSLFADFHSPDWQVLVVLVLLASAAELIEFLVGVLGSKSLQVPTGAIVASLVGGLAGAFIGVPVFLIGSLLGLLIGVFAGAFVYSLATGHPLAASLRFGIATLFSRVVSLFVKLGIAIGMAVYLGFQVF